MSPTVIGRLIDDGRNTGVVGLTDPCKADGGDLLVRLILDEAKLAGGVTTVRADDVVSIVGIPEFGEILESRPGERGGEALGEGTLFGPRVSSNEETSPVRRDGELKRGGVVPAVPTNPGILVSSETEGLDGITKEGDTTDPKFDIYGVDDIALENPDNWGLPTGD